MAYNTNITPGNPPLLWDKFKSALDEVNANFVTIGATLAGGEQKTITNTTQASPVVVTTSTAHGLTDGQRVTITDVVGMTQLNGNTYYADVLTSNTFALYTDAGISSAVNGTGFTAYASGGKTQGLNEFSTLNLEALTTSVKPADDAQKVLGDATHKWKEVHVAETLATAGNEDNGLYLGTAHVKGESGKVDLPFGSTINGDLIIDPEKRYFRYINLDDGDIVEADHTNDTLSFYGGTGVQLVAGSDADSITFINDGVTQAIASTGITVSSATGNVTFTNTGVTSAQNTTNIPGRATGRTPGEGVTVSSTTGAVQFTNTGVLEVQQGFGITVSTDPATGVVTVSNGAPAVPTFQQIAVDGQTSLAADSTADILTFEPGYGIGITLDSPNDKITIAVDSKIDITGSVFADDSGLLVDGVEGKIVGAVDTTSLRTSESKIALGEDAGQTSQGTASIAIGSGAGQTTQGYSSVAMGDSAGQTTQGNNAVALGRRAQFTGGGDGAVGIGYNAGYTGQGANAVAIGYDAGRTNQATNSIVINATGVALENTTVSSLVIKTIRNAESNTLLTYDDTTGEVTYTDAITTLAANIDQTTVNIGATTATAINIGNSGSTTTIDGTVSFSTALVANNITADDSIQITTAVGANNGITLNPQGTDTSVNITADALRLFGTPVTDNIKAVGGLEGDLTGSVFGDDSAMLVNGLDSKLVGDIDSVNIHGQAFKADTIVNNTGTTLDLTAAGFLNIYGGDTDAGVSNIQLDKQGINHIELKTEPGNPADPTDYARVAINAGTNEGDVRIGTPTSTRNQVVEVYNATVYGTLVGTIEGSIVGDVKGSIVADDSTVIVDGVAGKVLGPISTIVGDMESITGPGAISIDTLSTEITTTGADAFSIADGTIGQMKHIVLLAHGGDATIEPDTFANGTAVTLNAANDCVTLLYTTNGWMIIAGQSFDLNP